MKMGKNATSTFSSSDVLYAVADLSNAPKGTRLDVKWIAVDAENVEPNFEFQNQTLETSEENYTGPIHFQLSNAAPWPTGQYKVDLYLNDELSQSVEFEIQ